MAIRRKSKGLEERYAPDGTYLGSYDHDTNRFCTDPIMEEVYAEDGTLLGYDIPDKGFYSVEVCFGDLKPDFSAPTMSEIESVINIINNFKNPPIGGPDLF